ncbi:MAG: outer membrane beta-barrel protein [Bacteroidota bacterium]|nr:outer membrane beta-barrel protein [Bacteroidota bacterium]
MTQRILYIALLLFPFITQAQQGITKFKMPDIGRFYGTIINSDTKKPMAYASVALYFVGKDSAIAGVLSKGNGDFSLDNLPFGKFTLRVTMIGYTKHQQEVSLSMQNVEQDLGNINIAVDATQLNEANIQGKKNAVQMGIDRKIFNVDKNQISQGGTAADVLKNVPSVTIDADGNAKLRNAATQIYIDGRPATLTIDQIPADQIERVEIITNPSAKFDAGTSGGILNLVMKKNTKPGYNGIVAVGGGTGNRYNTLVSLNMKEKKFNIGFTYSLNHSKNFQAKGFTKRTNMQSGSVADYYNQDNVTTPENQFQMGRLGFDYYINNRNTITIAHTSVAGKFDIIDKQNFKNLDKNDVVNSYGNRTNETHNRFSNHTEQITWKRTYPKPGKELTADVSYNWMRSATNVAFTTDNYLYNGTVVGHQIRQYNKGENNADQMVAQLDYIKPLKKENTKIETGVRAYYKYTSTLLNATNWDSISNSEKENPFLSSNYSFTEMINAAYFNYISKYKKVGYQAGLRFEQSSFVGDPRNDSLEKFSYNYPGTGKNIWKSLFPAVYFSRKYDKQQEVQLNYSRKVNRPGFMQMMPFIMFADNKNYTIGNPRLAPEFINLAELNYQKIWKKGNLLSSLYFKGIEQPLTKYSYRSLDDTSKLVSTTINGKSQQVYGLDNTFKYTFFKKLDFTTNVNFFYTVINSDFGNTPMSNKGFNWTGKTNLLYKFPKDLSLQVTGSYESPKTIPQGTANAVYFMDASLVKEVKKFININLTLSDMFNTKRFGSLLDVPGEFYQTSSRRRETRYIKLTIMIRFGKMDASIFKRKPAQQGNNNSLDF